MENPIKMDDLGVPLCLETPVYTVQKLHLAISGINCCNFQEFFLQQYESLNISKGGIFPPGRQILACNAWSDHSLKHA